MRAVVVAALLAFAVTFVTAPPLSAQDAEAPSTSESAAEKIEQLKQQLDSGEPLIKAPPSGSEEGNTTGFPAWTLNPENLDEESIQALHTAQKAYFDYLIRGADHRSRVFEWQLLSSRLIFFMVIVIVAVGLYFSWMQFSAGLREKAGPEATSTTFEASTSGLKVSSPVLGVIILTLSLVFFYLYLVHVYPIEEIF
jgi:hypothetical protein